MIAPEKPLRLYRHALSGHSHRAEALLSMLGLPVELVEVNLAAREHKSPEFLAKNRLGQVPVLEDGTVVIADSSAILVYLALRYDEDGSWLPRDAHRHAEVTRWLSVAAGPLVQGPAAARLASVFGVPVDLEKAKAIAASLFHVLDAELAERRFLVGPTPTIADLAMYAYTAHAPEGGISLQPYPYIQRWLDHVRGLPGFVPMKATRTRDHA